MEIYPNLTTSTAQAQPSAPQPLSPSDLPGGEELLGVVADAAPDAEAGRRVRVLVVDDQDMVRRGLAMRLEIEPDLEVVGEAEDGAGAVEGTVAYAPDVVVMDVRMPGADGIEVAAALRLAYPEVAVVMLTLQDDAETRGRAEAAGASGFVGKHEPEGLLVEEIRSAAFPSGSVA